MYDAENEWISEYNKIKGAIVDVMNYFNVLPYLILFYCILRYSLMIS